MKRGLTCCFGTSLLALIAAALVLFVGLPMLVQYLTSQDKQPIFEIQGIGQRYRVGAYDVILIAVSHCAPNSCQPGIQTDVTFEVVTHGAGAGSGTSYSLSLLPGQSVSDMIQLEDGTSLRLVAVAVNSNQKYRVRFQAFLPPE